MAEANEILTALKRLTDRDNWRDVNLEDDEESSYDAMAWSPSDIPLDPNTGEVDDPLFHEPWELVRPAIARLERISAASDRLRKYFEMVKDLMPYEERESIQALLDAIDGKPEEGK